MFNKILIIGCGLIGSSILRAVYSRRLSKKIFVFFSPKPIRKFGLLMKKIDSSKLKKKSSGLWMKVFL